MGPRPPRRGAAAITGARQSPRPDTPAILRPVAPVGAPSPRRTAHVETALLPADTRRALSGIVKTMRDVPRAIIGDPAEVVHFLGRTARALERLRDQPVPVGMSQNSASAAAQDPARKMSRKITAAPPRALSARERAEAVFRSAPETSPVAAEPGPQPIALPAPRVVTDRKGRGVRVEVRRARAAGQLEMPL